MKVGDREPLDYERVREELAERGYLGGRVGRFLLQDGRRQRRVPRLLRTAIKAAFLGAPVLALLVAATVARDNRPLIAARDFPLLWLYFTPLCGVVLFGLNGIVGWISGRLSAVFGVRGGEITRAALLAGLLTVLYLFVLGRGAGVPRGLAVESGFFALGVLVVVFVSWLAGLVSVAGILGRTGEVAGRRRRPLRTLFIVVPLAMLALTAVRLGGGTSRTEEGLPVFDTVPSERFLFVGIDGIDGAWIESLEPSGAVERLLGLMSSGTVVPLRAEERGEPPEVWTSMLTGVSGTVHGVRSAGAEVFPGVATPLTSGSGRLPWVAALRLALPSKTIPASGAARRVRTVWEIVGLKRRVLSVGWWGSWPAEGGVDAPWIISDRVLPKLLSGAGFDRDAWPEALFTRLRGGFDESRDDLRRGFDDRFRGLDEATARLVWESFLIDAFHLRAVQELWTDGAIESAFVYLPGLDILRHRARTSDMTILQLASVFEGYTRWLDRAVGELVAAAGAGTTVMIVGDPGRDATPPAEGFAVLRSDVLGHRCIEFPTSTLAVAPLVLALNGFPLSDELLAVDEGACLGPLVATVGSIPTYGRKRIGDVDPASSFDQEMIERLRSLGYLN